MTLTSQRQEMVRFSNRKSGYPIIKFMSHFSTWTKFLLSAKEKKFLRKRQDTTDTTISHSQRACLYRATCHKLRPNHLKRTFTLGDVLHIRKFWEKIEGLIYQHDVGYVPSTKKVPFNPDIPGSVYLPKKPRKITINKTRQPFTSSHIVYTFKQDKFETRSIIEDDDDVPLGFLDFSSPSPHVNKPCKSF